MTSRTVILADKAEAENAARKLVLEDCQVTKTSFPKPIISNVAGDHFSGTGRRVGRFLQQIRTDARVVIRVGRFRLKFARRDRLHAFTPHCPTHRSSSDFQLNRDPACTVAPAVKEKHSRTRLSNSACRFVWR
jgi:hypothetical protein